MVTVTAQHDSIASAYWISTQLIDETSQEKKQ